MDDVFLPPKSAFAALVTGVAESAKPLPTFEHQAPSPPVDEELDTPQSSLTELIKDMKHENENLAKHAAENLAAEKAKSESAKAARKNITVIETTEVDDSERIEFDCNVSQENVQHVMSAIDCSKSINSDYGDDKIDCKSIDCKSISPVPSNQDEFEIPEIFDDVISTLLTDPHHLMPLPAPQDNGVRAENATITKDSESRSLEGVNRNGGL